MRVSRGLGLVRVLNYECRCFRTRFGLPQFSHTISVEADERREELRADNETKVTRRDEIETTSHETRHGHTRRGLETRPNILPETLSKKKKWLKFMYFAKKISVKKVRYGKLQGFFIAYNFIYDTFFSETKIFFRDHLARRDEIETVSSRLAFFRDETVSLPALGEL